MTFRNDENKNNNRDWKVPILFLLLFFSFYDNGLEFDALCYQNTRLN
jgi:hypothetical protein